MEAEFLKRLDAQGMTRYLRYLITNVFKFGCHQKGFLEKSYDKVVEMSNVTYTICLSKRLYETFMQIAELSLLVL